jgi:hypothetical protein
VIDSIKAYFFQGLCLVLLVLLAVQTWRLHNAQLEELQAKATLSNERAAASLSLAKQEKAHREKELSLQATADQTRKETNEAINLSATRRDVLLKRLRQSKPSANRCVSEATSATSTTYAGSAAVGSVFPGSLGEEDVQEASRGDLIRVELIACYRQYEDARKALNAQ